MNPKSHFRKLVRPVAIRLMKQKDITWEEALKLVWNDLILIFEQVDKEFPNLSEKKKLYEVGGRFDAFLRKEYDLANE